MIGYDADLVVVGLGPAGCACAVQAARAGLDVLAVDDALAGGLVGAANRIENLPLFPDGIDGAVLARRLARSVRRPGVRTLRATVTGLSPRADGKTGWIVSFAPRGLREVTARAVCVAAGTEPGPLPAWLAPRPGSGSSEATAGAAGMVVHRDVRSLPARLDGLRVAVVGGGDAAFDTALGTVRRGARVAVLVRGRKARAAAPLVSQVAGEPAIDVRLGWTAGAPVARECGHWRLVDERGDVLEIDQIVACVGRVPRLGLLEGLEIRDDTPRDNPRPGLFVAGDLLRERERFIAPALADGLRAAEAAALFLQEVRVR